MTLYMSSLVRVVAFTLLLQTGFARTAPPPEVPLYFEPNQGQFDDSVRFVARAADVPVGLFADGLAFDAQDGGRPLRLRFKGKHKTMAWKGLGPVAGVSNYLTSSAHLTNVARFATARANDVFPGIDVEVHGFGAQVEYDFIVHPGADPAQIRYSVEGGTASIDAGGELVLLSGAFELRNRAPKLYQERDGVKQAVAGRFELKGNDVSFAVGAYDKHRTLTIDPIVFSKTITPSGLSWASSAITDGAGNVFVVGYADAAFVPSSVASQKTFGGGSQDAVVMKFTASGDPVWATYLGGSGSDSGRSIMIEESGAVLVVGDTTSTDFPMVGASYQASNKGKSDGFIVRLNPQATFAVYSSYFGGNNDEFVRTALLDPSGRLVIGGYTYSTNLPTAGAPVLQSTLAGNDDFFLAKFSTTLTGLLLSTYLGGPGQDELQTIALDGTGNFYLAGWTTSTSFTATAGAGQSARAGQSDSLVVRLNPTATSIQMLTYLGGSLSDFPGGMAVESDGSAIWIAGTTNSTNFPTTAGVLQRTFAGSFDGTLTKLDNKGAILASTYMGGTGDDEGDSVILQDGIPVYVGVFTTNSYNKSDEVPGARFAAIGATMAFQTMKPDLSDTTATDIYIPEDADLAYVGDSRCRASAADPATIVCAGAGFPLGSGSTRGKIVVASTAPQSSGPTQPYPPISQVRPYKGTPAAPDPVDGATGAFYDTITDLQLGGPLPLEFKRYYSSTLSGSGFLSPVGTNWMSNFDQRVDANGSTARVLMFQGKVVTFTKNGTVWQLTTPLDIPYQFLQSGTNYKMMDPTASLIYTFNSQGAITRIEDRKGDAITIAQGPDGPVTATDGLGRTLNFSYTGGRLTRVQDQSSTRSVVLVYSGAAQISSTDVLGRTTTYSYTTAGQLSGLMVARQYPLGARVTQTYDANGRVTTQTLPTAKTTTMNYDAQGAVKVTDAQGSATSIGFDNEGGVTSFKDPLNSSFSVTYDSAGRRTGWTDKNGNSVSISYDSASGKVASERSAANITTSYTYTAQTQSGFTFYVRTGIAYADGTSASYVYDAKGNPTSLTDRTGAITRYTYDSQGRLSTQTAPTGAVTQYLYNSDSTVSATIDALANTTTYAYDTLKRLIKVTEPNGNITLYTYDLAGNRLTTQTPSGSTNTTAYDADQRRASYTYGGGGAFSFAYTQSGQTSSVTNPAGGKRSYTYDALDRLGSASDPSGVTARYSYDAAGQLAQVTSGTGADAVAQATYVYDKEGRVTSVTDGSHRTWAYRLDGDGRPVGLTPPGGGAFTLRYDAAGRLIGQTNALGDSVNFTVDGAGRITQTTVANTLTTSLKRNALGSVTEYTDPNGNKWGFAYDALERPTGQTDPLGNAWTLSYTKNRITGATFPLGSVTITTDADGHVTKRQFSDGTTINQSFDARGMIATADNFTVTRDSAGLPTATNGIVVGLDPTGRAKSFTYAPGKTVTYSYDTVGRPTAVTDWVGGTTSINYDGAGRIVGMTYPNGIRTTQAWDANGRLNRVITGSLASIIVTRNVLGQVTSAERNLPTTPALAVASSNSTYNAAGQLNGATYDTMGRATAQSGRTYTWNLASQLTGFTAAGQSTSLTYDGLSELSSLTFGGVTRNFVFNHLTSLPSLAIVRQGGNDLRYYVYLPDGELLYSIEAAGNARRFYHFDEMGNATFLTGDNGQITDSYAITPFGDVADHTGSTDNPFTWQGKFGVYQEASGLYFLRSRHYDAVSGRFLSRDNIITSDPRSGSPYVYAQNNPLWNIDPFGNSSATEVNSFVTAILNDPNTTASQRQAIYQGIATKLTDSFNNGKVDGWSYIIWMTILNGAYEHPDLDLTQVIQLAWPPDPPPPPPPPYIPPVPAPLLSKPAKTTSSLLGAPGTSSLLNSAKPAASLVDKNGNPLITNDGGSLITNDGGSLITNDGGSLITNDGGSLITNDGGSLITNDGGSLITNDGGSLLNKPAAGVISNDGWSVNK